jgi:hypothetical protein
MKRLRRITEAEVIAEFLRGEFFHPEFDPYREQFAAIVDHPNLTDDTENALRRALFFRRRDTLWWELPEDRQWWEIEFEPEDVDQVSVFPRAHWLRLSRGNLMATHVAERVRQQLARPHPEDVVRKIAAISAGTQRAGMPTNGCPGLIIFLGLDERHRVTLLEGNHRFVASLLAPERNLLAGARLIGVFSPSMEKCCWYKTNFQTLFRCLKNRIQHYWNREPGVAELLEAAAGPTVSGSAERPGPINSRIISH